MTTDVFKTGLRRKHYEIGGSWEVVETVLTADEVETLYTAFKARLKGGIDHDR